MEINRLRRSIGTVRELRRPREKDLGRPLLRTAGKRLPLLHRRSTSFRRRRPLRLNTANLPHNTASLRLRHRPLLNNTILREILRLRRLLRRRPLLHRPTTGDSLDVDDDLGAEEELAVFPRAPGLEHHVHGRLDLSLKERRAA